MSFLFEELDVYQASLTFVQDIFAVTKEFPKGFSSLSDQLRRAAMSVPANIAEGQGRFKSGDRTYFMLIARGSIFECAAHLQVAARLEIIPMKAYLALRDRAEAIGKMLTVFARRLRG